MAALVIPPPVLRSHSVSSSLPTVQAGFAEAPHQNPGNPFPAEPAHRRRCLRHAWTPCLATSSCHHPLPSPDPRTSPFPNAAGPCPPHAGSHRLRTLLEPLAHRGSVHRGWAGLWGLRAGGSAPGTCSPGWWENVVVDINPGFSFAWSGLPLERGAPTEPSQPRRASPLLPQPVLAPCSADEPRQCTEEDNLQISRIVSWPGPACPWPAGCFFITLPVTRLEGEELAGPWEKEHPSDPCQPSGKGTARGISA